MRMQGVMEVRNIDSIHIFTIWHDKLIYGPAGFLFMNNTANC